MSTLKNMTFGDLQPGDLFVDHHLYGGLEGTKISWLILEVDEELDGELHLQCLRIQDSTNFFDQIWVYSRDLLLHDETGIGKVCVYRKGALICEMSLFEHDNEIGTTI